MSAITSQFKKPNLFAIMSDHLAPALEAFTDDDYEWVRWNTTLNTFGDFTGNYTEEKAQAWLNITASKFG